MLVSDITETGFPHAGLAAKISFVLRLMDDYDVQHISVTSAEENFAGLISKQDLLDADENDTLYKLQHKMVHTSVLPQEYFLAALKTTVQFDVSVVPVVASTGELQGSITAKNLLQRINNFCGAEEQGAVIVLEMDKRNFSFGELSRLIETNDAYITQLNTRTEPSTGLLIASIRINKKEVSDIVATLQRYDYTIRHYFGEELYENELKENFNLLMNYLSI